MSYSTPSYQIADILAHSLSSVFENLCTERYGAPLSFRRLETPEASASEGQFRLKCGHHPPVDAHFAIRHVGGNMYDIVGTIDSGPTQWFSYCLPDPAPLRLPEAPRLGRDVATFLLNALEQQLGSTLLRKEIRKTLGRERRAPSPPPTSLSAA